MGQNRVDEVEKRKRFQANPESFVEKKDLVVYMLEPADENQKPIIKDRCNSDTETHIVEGMVSDHFRRKRDFMAVKEFEARAKAAQTGLVSPAGKPISTGAPA